MEEAQYLEDRLEDLIKWYDRKSGINKKAYQRSQFAQVVLASLITLSGVLGSTNLPWITLVVPTLGAAIAIISGSLGLYKFQENWLEYRTVSESLKHEKYLFLTKCEPYDGDKPFKLLVNRVEHLISSENSNWAQNMQNVAKDKDC
jgi:hypothetical protein